MSDSEQGEQSENDVVAEDRSDSSRATSPPPRRISGRQYAAYAALLKNSHSGQSRTLGQKLGRRLSDRGSSDDDDEEASEERSVISKATTRKRDAELSDLWPIQPTDLPANGPSLEETIRLFASAYVRSNRLSFVFQKEADRPEEDEDPILPPDLVTSVTSAVNEMLVLLATARPAQTGKKRKTLGPIRAENVLGLAACVREYTQHVAGASGRLAATVQGEHTGDVETATAPVKSSALIREHRMRMVRQAREKVVDEEDLYDSEIVPPANEKRPHQSAKERAARSERRLAKRQKREQAG